LDEHVRTQFVALHNLSSHDLAYSVDADCIDAVNAANYGFEVFAVLNAKGVISKKSSTHLRVHFRPIESKQYAFDLRVDAQIADGADGAEQRRECECTSLSVPIVGHGLADASNSKMMKMTTAESSECVGRTYAMTDTIRLSACSVRLSTERLCLGAVPLRCWRRRAVLLHNDGLSAVRFQWQCAVPCVSIKECEGEIAPNSRAVCEVAIRSDCEPCEVNDRVSVLLWDGQRQWRLFLFVQGSVGGIDIDSSSAVFATDKAVLLSTSLLSPRNAKRMSAMGVEADEVAMECCKALLHNALRSKEVETALETLSERAIPTAIDVAESDGSDGEAWKHVMAEMGTELDAKRRMLKDTEFHDFLEFFISETVFNLTAEMVEKFKAADE